MKKIMKVLMIFVIIIGLLVSGIWVMNQISVKPTISFLRWNLEKGEPFGEMGDYESIISSVTEEKQIDIKSNPDTSLKVYGIADGVNKPLIFFIHGGGWSLGSGEDVAFYAKLLSTYGYVVANVDYALAPEYKYPTSTVQLMDSINYLMEHADEYHIDKNNIIIMGNSAGAHLSAQLGALISNESYRKEMNIETKITTSDLKGLVLYNGVYDFRSAKGNKFPFFNSLTRSYTGYRDIEKFEHVDQMSPSNYIISEFPPALIVSGDSDPLKLQSIEFSDLIPHGILMTGFKNKDLNHDFMFNLNEETAVEVLESVIKFIDDQVSE